MRKNCSWYGDGECRNGDGYLNCCSVFTSFSLRILLLTPLSFKFVRNSSGLLMSIWSFRSSWMPSPRVSKRLACAAVTLGVPSALTRSVILVWTLFCCIHSLICLAGERMSSLGRHLTREGCVRTRSMARTSGKARCAPAIKKIYIDNYI